MFDKFSKETWIPVYYTRKDKVHLNRGIIKRLEDKLNSNGQITEVIKNPLIDLQISKQKIISSCMITVSKLPVANAVIYSDSSPINLEFYDNLKISSVDPFFGQDINRWFSELRLSYFSSADKKDIKFIHKCLKDVRFEEYKKEISK
jgi:hypothetical protein